MMSYCAYGDCTNKYIPCAKIAFFTLPRDYRRPIWIENSGNPSLQDIKPTANRHFCEKHFDMKYIRRQFNRTILKKDAVPYRFQRIRRRILNRALSVEEEVVDVAESTSRSLTDLQSEPEEESLITSSLMQDHDEDEITYIQTEDQTLTIHPSSSIEQLLDDDNSSDSLMHTYTIENDMDEAQEPEPVVVEIEAEENQKAPSQLPCEISNLPQEQPACINIKHEVRQTQAQNVAIVETRPAYDDCDEDKHYILSLLGHFKRLPPKTKAIAKWKILQYLTELEFDNISDALK